MRLAIVKEKVLQDEILKTEWYRKNRYVDSRYGVFMEHLNLIMEIKQKFIILNE